VNICITGGCGFIGHHVIQYLLEKTDHSIVSLDRLDYSSTSQRLADIGAYKEHPERLKIVWHDLRAPINDSVAKACGEPDIILHLAASSSVDRSILYPLDTAMDNVIGTINLLDYAWTLPKLKTVVVFSTDEVFGPAPPGYSHKEHDEHMPSNPYSASKSAGVQFAQAYLTTYKLPVIITYTMNVFGERQHQDKLVPKTMRRVMAGEPMDIHCRLVDGKPTEIGTRIWIYAPCVADALWKIVTEGTIGERYNIIGFDELDNLTIAQKVADTLGRELIPNFVDFHNARPGHDRAYRLDGTKLKNMGWTPPFNFEEGLARTVRFTLEHTQWL
jgi:dTDP-glucose 4,6-dehydratase